MNATIDDALLLAALKAWPLSEPLHIQRLPGGMTSEIWRVEAGGECFIAKYTDTSQSALEGGLCAAELAQQHGILSGAPLRTKEGLLSMIVENLYGQGQPLALLRFVPGEQLSLSDPDTASLYGSLLGRTHSILLNGLGDRCTFDLYNFLREEDADVAAQAGLATLIRRAVEAAQGYEARRRVTFGVIWSDRMEIRCDASTGRLGIIDWGAIGRGPLLFDVALAALWYFREGSQSYAEFIHAYVAEAPMHFYELEGISYYKALFWARQAKYFAYRLAHNVMLGDLTPEGNAENLAMSRRELERALARL